MVSVLLARDKIACVIRSVYPARFSVPLLSQRLMRSFIIVKNLYQNECRVRHKQKGESPKEGEKRSKQLSRICSYAAPFLLPCCNSADNM